MNPRTFLNELITDLKAAASIGHPESLSAVIERLRAAGEDEFLPSGMVPLGEALAGVEPGFTLPLLEDPDAAVRGVAAVAAALRAARLGDVPEEALLFAADDPAPEVRAAFAQAASRDALRAAALAAVWLGNPSRNVRDTGLRVLAAGGAAGDHVFAALEPLDAEEDHAFRAALVDALCGLAESGAAGGVLALLERWTSRPEPNVWVITRALSGSWVQAHLPEAQSILDALAGTAGEIRPILRTKARLADGDAEDPNRFSKRDTS